MPLATVAAVKAKLDLPADDASRDDAIAAVLATAEAWVLSRTFYSLTAERRTDVHEAVAPGAVLQLRRPVVAVETVTGWVPGWTDDQRRPLGATLHDPESGRLTLTDGTGPSAFPPATSPLVPWGRWRAASQPWPMVQVVYTTGAISPPADLVDVTAALAAYWYERHGAGAAQSQTVSPLTVVYLSDAVPAWVRTVVARHTPRSRYAVWV